MAKGIIYIMTTAVPGLIKIGKTNVSNYSDRMYNLEHNGYRNVTALKRAFAIEVDSFDEKEVMLHTIFAKSRLDNTELFALDVNIAIQLLSSFEGNIVYPKTETKEEIFEDAVDNRAGHLIPNGIYTMRKTRQKDGKVAIATAKIQNGEWTLLKGSTTLEDANGNLSQKARILITELIKTSDGVLTDDAYLGAVSPSCATAVVYGNELNGWEEWKNSTGKAIDYYRKNKEVADNGKT